MKVRTPQTRVKTAPCRVYASRADHDAGIVSHVITPSRASSSRATARKARAATTTVVKTRITSADHARILATITTNRVDWNET